MPIITYAFSEVESTFFQILPQINFKGQVWQKLQHIQNGQMLKLAIYEQLTKGSMLFKVFLGERRHHKGHYVSSIISSSVTKKY